MPLGISPSTPDIYAHHDYYLDAIIIGTINWYLQKTKTMMHLNTYNKKNSIQHYINYLLSLQKNLGITPKPLNNSYFIKLIIFAFPHKQ